MITMAQRRVENLATFFTQCGFCCCDKSHDEHLPRREREGYGLHFIILRSQGRETQLKSGAAGKTETMVECCFL